MITRARAVFLDRDGVLNRAVVTEGKPYPPDTLDQFELLSDAAESCRRLKDAGYLLIVVTNQPDVGRGTQKKEVVEAMHRALCEALPIDHIEVCYDPGEGQPSEFRKPAPGMILRAVKLFAIDLEQSFMIGDRWRDIDCGYAAGCKTVFIDYGYREALRQAPDWRVASLAEATSTILDSASTVSASVHSS